MEYSEEEFLLLSGIQHYCFCRRQWALIHIEQLWKENLRTAEGRILHERCHDDSFIEKRSDLLIVRGLRVLSRSLGVTGQCDVVEFYQSDEGCVLQSHEGRWSPYPVEYKHGKSKISDEDRLQLCCQALCLEEMLCVAIEKGALFYHETHRREEITFDVSLREKTKSALREMHDLYRQGRTPLVKPQPACRSCSMKDLCLPVIAGKTDVGGYYKKYLEQSEP